MFTDEVGFLEMPLEMIVVFIVDVLGFVLVVFFANETLLVSCLSKVVLEVFNVIESLATVFAVRMVENDFPIFSVLPSFQVRVEFWLRIESLF